MTIQDIGSIGELIAAIATVATLAYLALQIRQNSTMLASAQAVASREGSAQLAAILASDRDAARVYWSGSSNRASLESAECQQFDAMLSMVFLNYAQNFALSTEGTVESVDAIIGFGPGVAEWWSTYAHSFPVEFRTFIDERLRLAPKPNTALPSESA